MSQSRAVPVRVHGAHYAPHEQLRIARAGSESAHVGAEDNASGVAALLEVARSRPRQRARDVRFVAFSAEEIGVLGSKHFVEHLPEDLRSAEQVVAMLNMDMGGRVERTI